MNGDAHSIPWGLLGWAYVFIRAVENKKSQQATILEHHHGVRITHPGRGMCRCIRIDAKGRQYIIHAKAVIIALVAMPSYSP